MFVYDYEMFINPLNRIAKRSMLWWIGLIVFSAVLTQAVGQYASECQLPDKQPGICMPVKSCKSALGLLQKIQANGGNISPAEREQLTQRHCGTSNDVVHVCCLESDIQLNIDGLKILKNQDCGLHTVDKVSHGSEAQLSGYPWMALLVYNNTYDPYRCGGALISERYVLTAAHCMGEDLYMVRLGEHRISTHIDCKAGGRVCAKPAEDIGIERTISHPLYRRSFHDIALIRLQRDAVPQNHIKPVCLPIYDDLRAKVHSEYTIAGWGRTDKAEISDVLMVAKVPLVSRPECQTIMGKYRLRLPLSYGHICAGNRNRIDSCDGDSGGPLGATDTYEERPRFVQFGVVSFGVNYCGEGDAPNIYTNVSHYLQWVTDNMRI